MIIYKIVNKIIVFSEKLPFASCPDELEIFCNLENGRSEKLKLHEVKFSAGSNPVLDKTIHFATYIPFNISESRLRITIRRLDTGELCFAEYLYCRKHTIEIVSKNSINKLGNSGARFDTSLSIKGDNSIRQDNHIMRSAVNKNYKNSAIFTICSKNFLAHARTLWRSLQKFYPHRPFYVVLCDRVDGYFNPDDEPFDFIYLEDIGLPDLEGMSQRYNITEFNTSIKPFAFSYIFSKFDFSSVVYLDPDIYVVSPLIEVDELLNSNVQAILTPHILQPAENDEVHDGKMLLFGIYNLGFLALTNSPDVIDFLAWWGRRLEKQCVIDLANGIFVDQKWADLIPSFLSNTHILHHPGYNVAYWNLPQRNIEFLEGTWYSNKLPLRFVHFSGNQLDKPNVFSRHSQQVTVDSIGDLRQLKNQYCECVYLEGHNKYRSMPYAFSWSGATGVNLHTPEELDASDLDLSPDNLNVPINKSSIRLLYLDWAVPKPDIDAGSVTASLFLKIFFNAGFDVTFLPGSLKADQPYSDSLKKFGVRVITSDETSSVNEWLAKNAVDYDVFFLSRGPVCYPFLDLIRQLAPDAKVIFNTVDLHYLRETREAVLSGDREAIKNAENTKRLELDFIKKADVTIVLSNEEVYKIRQEIPNARLVIIPIVFDQIPGSKLPFEMRRDILFIGSFPHKPNIDAVLYFINEIFPLLRTRLPNVHFKIVGANPPPEILELQSISGVDILGFVSDLSDVFDNIKLSVAPLRYGAGIKGKIGTSFCYGVPCIATSIAAEGMGLRHGTEVLVADDPNDFVDLIVNAYSNKIVWTELSCNSLQFVQENYSMDVIERNLIPLVKSMTLGWDQIDGLQRFSSHEEWIKYCGHLGMSIFHDREIYEQSLLPVSADEGFLTDGYCCLCKEVTTFLTSNMYSTGLTPDGRVMPNWREHQQCQKCGFVNRVRASLHCLHSYVLPGSDDNIYITEQLTPAYQWLKERYNNLVGSEFFGSEYTEGEQVGEFRNENVMSLSFEDRSFDRVLSFDVLEHVPDHMKAFKELYRVLDDGGFLLFSVPFAEYSYQNIVRAIQKSDGTIQHLLEPEYHGNPVDPEGGALCFQHFGWEILDQLRASGFKKAEALGYWSPRQGYLGKQQFLFLAMR